jgi:hypothetical protein
MAQLKTKPTRGSVDAFLDRIADHTRRQDSLAVLKLMKRVTRAEPKMWGSSIVGFGEVHYKYPSGREGDWFLAGFSPRKQDLTVYLVAGVHRSGALLRKLGRHKTGKSCLYIKRLADVDLDVLRQLVEESVESMKAMSRPPE